MTVTCYVIRLDSGIIGMDTIGVDIVEWILTG